MRRTCLSIRDWGRDCWCEPGANNTCGKRFDWQEKDIFCAPAWMWHEHANASDGDDACLFSFNDFPVMEKLGFYREEAFAENDGHQTIEAVG